MSGSTTCSISRALMLEVTTTSAGAAEGVKQMGGGVAGGAGVVGAEAGAAVGGVLVAAVSSAITTRMRLRMTIMVAMAAPAAGGAGAVGVVGVGEVVVGAGAVEAWVGACAERQ